MPERLAHDAVRYPETMLGRGSARTLRRAGVAAAGGGRQCRHRWGTLADEHAPARICVTGMAGDQQAALVGQACFQPGMGRALTAPATSAHQYRPRSGPTEVNRLAHHRRLPARGPSLRYAVEGSIFNAGARRAMAARRARRRDAGGGNRGVGAPGLVDARPLPSCRPSRASVRRIGMPMRAARWSASRATSAGRRSRGPRGRCLPRHAVRRCDARGWRSTPGGAARRWRHGRQQLVPAVSRRPARHRGRSAESARPRSVPRFAGLGAGLYKSLDDVASLWKSDRRFEPQNESRRTRRALSRLAEGGRKGAVDHHFADC